MLPGLTFSAYWHQSVGLAKLHHVAPSCGFCHSSVPDAGLGCFVQGPDPRGQKNKNANEMELLSMIVYLNKREDVCRANKKCLVERIRELKPHFSLSKIESGIDELSSFGYLN